ncbi:MAG: sterol desaturase family protein [Deltaproteobacteria bacterium]|nr:sterol desaturase family protein [Deltaproteobacteria bacterium]
MALAAFVFAFVFGTLVEYVMHRWMHDRRVLGARHAEHHRVGTGQGVLGEFWDYTLPGVPVIAGLLLGAWWSARFRPLGLGFVAGDLAQMFFAAYAHQAQHERPELVFWMRLPVHYVHHHHKQWHHNFGISVDWWDRAFGTFKSVPWAPEKRGLALGARAFLRVRWW